MGAIIKRELIDVFRTPKSFLMQIALAVVFSLLVILQWPTEGKVDLSSQQSRQVFQIFGYGLLTVIVLMSPAFPATSVVREKITGTLALLFNTPITPIQIYFGKLIGVCGFLALLLIMSFPAAACCMILGGVSFSAKILPLYSVLTVLVLQYAVLGLWVSSRSSATQDALRTTYLLIVALAVFSLLPYLMFQGSDSLITDFSWWIRSISPIPAVSEILGHGHVGSQGIATEGGAPLRFILIAGLTIVLLVIDTLYRFNHRLFDKARASGVMANDMTTKTQWLRRIYYLVDPMRRSGNIPNFVNPVLIKEFRCRKFGRSHWLFRLIAICAIVSLVLSYLASTESENWGTEIIGGIMILLQASLIVLFTPSLSSGLICGELESGGWQLLKATPLSVIRIVSGKVLSVITTMAIVISSTLPGYLVMGWIVPEKWPQITQVITSLVLATFFSVMASSAISSLFKRTSTSTAVSYAFLSLLYVGTLFFWLFRGAPFGPKVVETMLMFNPISAALQVIETPGFTEYNLVGSNFMFLGAGCVFFILLLIVQTYRLSKPQ